METTTEQMLTVARIQPERRRFTAHEYLKLAELGVLAPDEKLELIDGEIYKKMSPIGLPHIWCVGRLDRLFHAKLLDKACILVQTPLRLDDYNEPEPDVVLFPLEAMNTQPTAKDALLVVEVSDSTLNIDRKVKLPLYARFDVVEVWIVNLSEKRLEAYGEAKEGMYRQVRVYDETEVISPVKFPDVSFSVGEILGTKLMKV